MPEPGRALPQPTPETKHFWDGTQAGELRLQRCDECSHTYFPPRPFCPKCASRKVSVLKASGRAILDTYVIHHRKVPGFEPPYAIAVVKLAEGPRMMTNIVECRADARGAAARHAARGGVREAERRHHAALLPPGERLNRCHTTQSPSSAPRRPRNSA